VRTKWQNSAADQANFVPPAFRTLNQVHAGTPVRIKRLEASPEVNQRLREMGFNEEQKIRVVTQSANLICQINSVRLGLSPGLAESIWVEPLAAG
jgi:Fe2+ transport system protein FeoA